MDSVTKTTRFDLRSLPFSPDNNPFLGISEIRTRTKTVRTRATPKDMVDPDTGEIVGSSIIHVIEEKDEEQFVKVFTEGVRAAYNLSRTGARVFQTVLDVYQREKMTGGFADTVSLYWFGKGLDGHSIGMSEYTFRRGLKELLEKKFLFPRIPNQYWINPALFFKGDRVAFMREYRLKSTSSAIEEKTKKTTEKDLFDL